MTRDIYRERLREMAYEMGERYSDRYSGIALKGIAGVNHYYWHCVCGAKGEPVQQPTREQYNEIRAELAKHERGHKGES